MLKKIKEAWDIINYPIGKDDDFDKECETSFIRFLDRTATVCYIFFAVFGCVSVYFLITHEVLK